MINDCCVKYHAQGYSVCLVCHGQEQADRKERGEAYRFRGALAEGKPGVEQLVAAGILPVNEVLGTSAMRRPFERNPNRRQFFRLTGIYLPEREARQALQRIEEFKWLEAEKVGYDIWKVTSPECTLRGAARHWVVRHLQAFLAACRPEVRQGFKLA